MKVITRNFLNKNLKIIKNDNIYTYNDYISFINKAKTYLIKERNAKPGQKILFASTLWPHYLAWFIAASELGMSFVVSDFPLLHRSKSVNTKLSLYGEIDHVIKSNASEMEEFFSASQNSFWKNKIFDHTAYEYCSEECSAEFWVKETDILLYATSSGTTNTPKVTEYSQEFFYMLADRNAKLYKLDANDKCLHTRNLHHGSVVGVYFLPTLKYCENHFPDEFVDLPGWVTLIEEHKINRALFFYNMSDIFVEKANYSKINSIEAEYFVLSPVTENFLKFFDNKSKIYSVFGSSETSGPLFLPRVTKDMIETKNFGKPLDDFYKIKIIDDLISVIMPDGRVTTSGDKFKIIDGNFIHLDRSNVYKINGVALYLDVLIKVVEEITLKKHTVDFDIVVDSEYNSIYIRSNNYINLKKLNKKIVNILGFSHYVITKQVNEKRSLFFNGIKFDPFDIRLICREIK